MNLCFHTIFPNCSCGRNERMEKLECLFKTSIFVSQKNTRYIMSILFWRLLNYSLNHSCSGAQHYGLHRFFFQYLWHHMISLAQMVCGTAEIRRKLLLISSTHTVLWFPQVLKYLDYVFTGVFTFEMVIKVNKTFLSLCHWCKNIFLFFVVWNYIYIFQFIHVYVF